MSCSRYNAVVESPPGPDQNTSAEAAARGQTVESRFSGEDCSVQSRCWPPMTSAASAEVRFAVGSKTYECCQVLKGSHQLFPVGKSPTHPP